MSKDQGTNVTKLKQTKAGEKAALQYAKEIIIDQLSANAASLASEAIKRALGGSDRLLAGLLNKIIPDAKVNDVQTAPINITFIKFGQHQAEIQAQVQGIVEQSEQLEQIEDATIVDPASASSAAITVRPAEWLAKKSST